MIRVEGGIVEDEPISLRRLERLLKELDPELDVVLRAENCVEAIKLIEKHAPDVLFLDVNLGECDAFEILRSISYDPLIIFVTAYDDYALRAFDENAIDYVLKPVTKERLGKTLEKLKKFGGKGPSQLLETVDNLGKIPVRNGEDIVLVDSADIIYLVADGKKTIVVTKRGEFKTNSTLGEMERVLPKDGFIRVHRSYIVSLEHVSRIRRWFNGGIVLVMDNGDTVKVSKGYQKLIARLLGL